MFDCWLDNSIHYVALFCVYFHDGEYLETLISCAPLLNEDDLSAQQHLDFIVELLSLYDRSIDNVLFVVGENCAVNQLLAALYGVAFIGCDGNKFNFGVEKWITKRYGLTDALNTVRKVMSRIRQIKNVALLRELTNLGAVFPNETRWAGKFEMVDRIFRIEEHLSQIPELDLYLPTPLIRLPLVNAVDHLKRLKSISVSLQEKGMLLSDDRFTADAVCKYYPSMKYELSTDSSIVRDRPFETAVNKILNGVKIDLQDNEKEAVKALRVYPETEDDKVDLGLLYFEKIQSKRRKLSSVVSSYMNCKFVPATTCSVERLFSAAQWVLTDLQKRMSPILFEGLLFLKINRRLWDINSVSFAMKINPSQRYANLVDYIFYGA